MGLPFDGDYGIEKYGPDWSDSKVYRSSDGDFCANVDFFRDGWSDEGELALRLVKQAKIFSPLARL
jgi:hypothetical protein